MRRAAALVALASIAACAPTGETVTGMPDAASSQPRPCFYRSQVSGYREGETQNLFVRVTNDDVYEVSAGGCIDLDFSSAVSLVPDFGDAERLCVGDSARLVTSGPGRASTPCRARIVRRLSETELAALPARDRP